MADGKKGKREGERVAEEAGKRWGGSSRRSVQEGNERGTKGDLFRDYET